MTVGVLDGEGWDDMEADCEGTRDRETEGEGLWLEEREALSEREGTLETDCEVEGVCVGVRVRLADKEREAELVITMGEGDAVAKKNFHTKQIIEQKVK